MKISIYYILIFSIILNKFNLKYVNAKLIKVKNNDDNFYNLKNLINNNQDEELIINFVDDYYNMTLIEAFSIDISLINNVSLIGNINGTVFDYNHQGRKGPFKFSTEYNYSLTFENIIFTNFNQELESFVYILAITSKTEQFHVYINNCSFKNNNYDLILLNFTSSKKIKVDPQIQFNNTEFINNKRKIIHVYHNYLTLSYSQLYDNAAIKFKNTRFIKNRGLFQSHFSKFIFENLGALFSSNSEMDKLIFINTIFENINVESPQPLIYGYGLILE
ncbi:hypothetical protein BCR36DRAFT_280853 [Piromyces finnis]|uniref:Uncharacterized protein n=1 Tax=Piromyces finnis TaxID=1754191 RepID=A0A1Y1VH16_9FUNG|nr:hypothetical protein BCR36DRAFT_280853 [Piromyces finnis]|eukprot:ORX56027.1 hypothetical protein BCR36DRAFT_280853 [Piromyces finnis]